MKYTDLLKDNGINDTEISKESVSLEQENITETETENKNATDILRKSGFKIRLVTSTSFGTQIDFAKKYDPEEIKKVLDGFNIKIKDKSVFIVD